VDDNRTAVGGIVADVSFMWLCDQRPAPTYTATKVPTSLIGLVDTLTADRVLPTQG
jgi:hypothetical protein